MFFFLSKTLDFLLSPLIWLFILAILALIFKKKRKVLLVTFFSLFTILTTPLLIQWLFIKWERAPVPLKELEDYDVAIVLTGITRAYKSPHDRVYIEKGADRVLHTLQLYKTGKIKKIVISGGSGLLINKNKDVESENLKKIFLLGGVNEADLFLEDKSRNTHENAVFTAQLLKEKFPGQKYLLVTSAFHMRRAEACFRKEKVSFDIYPADFYTDDPDFYYKDIIPSPRALVLWEILTREVSGFVVYKLAGYI